MQTGGEVHERGLPHRWGSYQYIHHWWGKAAGWAGRRVIASVAAEVLKSPGRRKDIEEKKNGYQQPGPHSPGVHGGRRELLKWQQPGK